MDELLQYIFKSIDRRDNGTLANFPDPAPPTEVDLDSDFTPDEKRALKKLLKEMSRFSTAP